jgi:predicted methyltransferase
LPAGGLAIDATVGNGHDTVFLANQVGPTGRVYGFDVQASALEAAARRTRGLDQVRFIHAGHEQMVARVPADAAGRINAIMFNLGYRPGGERSIVTRPETTLAAFRQGLDLLAPGGRMSLVLYPGHEGGAEEAEAVRDAARHLNRGFTAGSFQRIDARADMPELVLVERSA